MSGFKTIVADPPWSYPRKGGGYKWREGLPSGESGQSLTPYETMTVDEIASLSVESLAAEDAFLFIWTTQRFVWDARRVVEAWGFRPVKLLVWAKPPTGFTMGEVFGNACEFVLWARRGKQIATGKVPRDWWEWPRSGGHSAKPDAFLDLVEQVSPGPYLELFARRARFGWSYAGEESLGDVEIDGLRNAKEAAA